MEANQPQFKRSHLNLLMWVPLVLIILLNIPHWGSNNVDSVQLPIAPLLDVVKWKTQGRSQVWYVAHNDNGLHLSIWYQAGYRYDPHGGEAYALTHLLNWQARASSLPAHFQMSPDFLKVQIQLSTNPLDMKAQIDGIRNLLYHPKLPNSVLAKIRSNYVNKNSHELMEVALINHPYKLSMDKLLHRTRADIQHYHQSRVTPDSAYIGFTGDLSVKAARILLEALLPAKANSSAWLAVNNKQAALDPIIPIHYKNNQQNRALISWPLISDTKLWFEQQIALGILNDLSPNQTKVIQGRLMSLLLVKNIQHLEEVLKQKLDSAMIAQLKRQLASHWIQKTYTAKALSNYLVFLNAFELPQNHLQQSLELLKQYDVKAWQLTRSTLLAPIINDG